ncbi:MAG: HAMP domain-containing histidine kinase [Bacteroidetes bacterium]|nr:HAMP domain-containing histidine kinase [Bacteroidota bacterium]
MSFFKKYEVISEIDQQRKITLGTSLIIVYFLIDAFFFGVNLFNPSGEPWIFMADVFLSGLCLWLMRNGRVDLSILLFLLRGNSTVFYFSMVDEIETGTFMYFFSLSLTALVFYGYRERLKGITYASITIALFLISQFNVNEFRPDRPHFYFITNYLFVWFTAGFIFLFLDRLNRSAEEEIRKKNDALQKANEELDRFVYHASHDLRAPLSSIMGLTSIYHLEGTKEGREQAVRMIADRALKLEIFIKEILAYSQNARTKLEVVSFNLCSLIEECKESIKYLPSVGRVNFIIDIAPDFQLTADQVRIKIILINLLSNAVKYADFTKLDPFIKLSIQKRKQAIELLVEDNGIGIDKAHQAKLFGMFYRAHFHSEGSGLGLYIVQECAQKLNGKVTLESELGVGTTVRLQMPILQ